MNKDEDLSMDTVPTKMYKKNTRVEIDIWMEREDVNIFGSLLHLEVMGNHEMILRSVTSDLCFGKIHLKWGQTGWKKPTECCWKLTED
jgi:hypothetical protein